MSTQATETRELALIDKVELRIALADSDAKLQSILNTYLAPLLLKLSSEHLSVRNKVISICQHVNTRIKAQNIRLPIAALLKQFRDNPQSALLRHFDLLFVQQGISRLQSSEFADLLPVFVAGIAQDASTSAMHGGTIFHLFLRSLSVFKLPPKGSKEDSELRTTLNVSDADAQFLSSWLGKLVLLRVSASTTGSTTGSPGLSQDEYGFLTVHGKPEAWDPSKDSGLNLTETKMKAVHLLASGLFNSDERFFPALFAAADPNSRISDVGEDLMKRTLPAVDLDDTNLVSRLYTFYNGSSATLDSSPANIVPPVRIPVRTKILSVLSRTSTSTTFPAKIIALVQRDLIQDVQSAEGVSRTDREATKLRSAIISFLTFVARRASKQDLDAIARPVITSLKHYIEHQEEDDRSAEIKTLRGGTYEIIGHLAGAHKAVLLETNLSLLKWLIQSLSEERDKDVVVSIDEALSITLRCFQEGLDADAERSLQEVLLQAMSQESKNARNLRYAAVRFANRCLAYKNVVARWIDILALGQVTAESHETVEEAKKGLDPYWYRLFHASDGLSSSEGDQSRNDFPKFADLVDYIFEAANTTSRNSQIRSLAVPYCRQALIWESLSAQGIPVDVGAEWERKLDLAVSQDPEARRAMRKQLNIMAADARGRDSIVTLWQAGLEGMLSEHVAARLPCARVLVELCTLGPDNLTGRMSSNITALVSPLLANDLDLRIAAAQAYGLLSSHLGCESTMLEASLEGLLQTMETWEGAAGAAINKVHGATLGLSSFTSHRLHRRRGDPLATKTLSRFLPIILAILDKSTEPQLYQASSVALGQLCTFYTVTVEQISAHLPYSDVVSKIFKSAKTGNETSITAMGHLSMIIEEDGADDKLTKLIDQVYELHEIRQSETQFAVGEAISYVTSGWGSSALTLDMDGPVPSGPSRTKTLAAFVDRVLGDAKTTKPSMKKAAVIWLLCFIQFCGDRQEVQERLPNFQAAFKRCLSDRDELVQEAASRGLGLVYERGTKELKDDLVKDLVGAFSSNRADMAGTVTEDTQLFAPGALPTGEGSIQTYKDIMSLASETGDSSLVYRFMSLASNNAIWSSRAAFGRFGLSNVLSDSSVDGYLSANPKLYPKLFRYRFDPNGNVRKSMSDIWHALVKDSTTTINTHFNSILEDLLVHVVNGEWRVRQASCAAIADLVQGRNMDIISPYLEEIWGLCFKVLDDIKESVRGAAAELSRVMIGILIRSLESDEGSANAAKMLKGVLPFLLSTSGIESSAKEVQAVSLHTLLEIIKKGKGSTLRPFLAELIESLLGLLTALEPSGINQIHMNASKYGITEQQLDDMRESSIRSGPLMGGVERCLDLLDEGSMKQLAPRLRNAMRSAVGLPSKVGCSRVLVSLSTRGNFLFRPFADDFMVAIRKCMTDRNERVCSSYAIALGHVARVGSDASIVESAAYAKRLYFESEDVRSRIVSGEVVRAVGKYASDRFAALAGEFLPLVYIGRQDGDEEVSKLMKGVWEDNTGGPRAASLYLAEIVGLARAHLDSKRWILKHAAALAIAEATNAVAATQGQVGGKDGELLWPALQAALAEKSWDGKERVLSGFVTFVRSGVEFWSARVELGEAIRKIATREAKRRNAQYQPFALACLGDVTSCMEDVSLANATVDIVAAVVAELSADGDAMDVDGKTGEADGDEELLRRKSLAAALDALFQAACVFVIKRQPAENVVRRILHLARGTLTLHAPANNPIHRAIFTGLQRLVGKMLDVAKDNNETDHNNLLGQDPTFYPACAQLLLLIPLQPMTSTSGKRDSTSNYVESSVSAKAATSISSETPEALRLLHSEAVLSYARLALAHPQVLPRCRAAADPPLAEQLHDSLDAFVSKERALVVRKNLSSAIELITKLKA